MPRFHATATGPVQFTAEEEAERDAQEAAHADRVAAEQSLEARQAQVWERIKAHRELLSDTGGYKATVSGVEKWFHSDGKSKNQQIALVVAGAAVPAVQWKTMDGTFITMSQAWAGAIFAAAAAQDAAIFAKAEFHRLAMEAAADPLAYDFSGGWPAVYGG